METNRLSSSDEVDQRYTTLSHCWGSTGPSLKLLQGNIAEFRTAVPWEPLPLTFKDAMVAFHKLGLRYIWIDALCIIQDSSQNWTHESGYMTDVYSGGFINISAALADDGNGDLFTKWDPRVLQSFATPVNSGLSEQPWCCKLSERLYSLGVSLHDRAWVVQERFLSPRVVHFTQGQIHWECIELSTSENVPGLHEKTLEEPLSIEKSHFVQELFSTDLARSPTDDGGLYSLWDHLASQYSRCSITIDTDCPVTIAGLARLSCKMLQLQQDDYACGLWRPQVLFGMMWESTRQTTQARNSEVVCIGEERIRGAPSWSWLSASARKYLRSFRRHWHDTALSANAAEVLDISVSPLGAGDRFGAIETGKIRTRAPMCQANISIASNGFEHEEECSSYDVTITIGSHSLRDGYAFKVNLELTKAQHVKWLNEGLTMYLLAIFVNLSDCVCSYPGTNQNDSIESDESEASEDSWATTAE